MNKSFSGQNKENLITKEETYTDGTNKTVKVTRESSSVEETKKTEKIPDGTKRTLKITRESFLEETKKSVSPETVLPEEIKESVKILDESFSEESKENVENDDTEQGKTERTGSGDEKGTGDNKSTYREIDESDDDQIPGERLPDENRELVEADDNILKKIVKAVFKVLFYPLYALNIL